MVMVTVIEDTLASFYYELGLDAGLAGQTTVSSLLDYKPFDFEALYVEGLYHGHCIFTGNVPG